MELRHAQLNAAVRSVSASATQSTEKPRSLKKGHSGRLEIHKLFIFLLFFLLLRPKHFLLSLFHPHIVCPYLISISIGKHLLAVCNIEQKPPAKRRLIVWIRKSIQERMTHCFGCRQA